MRRMRTTAAVSIAVATAAMCVSTSRAADDTSSAALLAHEQRALQDVCGTKCHRVELFATARKSYEDWHDTVQKMVDRGAIGSDEQFADLMDYLFRTQTLIDVNSVDVQDLQIVLNTSPAVAGAVVARRTKKKFTSLEDLKSVGGLDAAAVDAKADLLVFR
ncbi:MAG: helix-hairpin-helix domain-containing protein [Povalibacter sp.]